MPSRPQTVATLGAIVLALVIAAILGVTRISQADAVSGTVPGTALARFGSSWSLATNTDKYRYVIVGRSVASQAASQPGLSLVYHSGQDVNANWDAGVPYSVAAANGWLLKNSAGAYLTNTAYAGNYVGDVGNAAYQAEWARRVGDYLASVGADGVYIDNVHAYIFGTGGVYPTKYPSQSAWETAMASFMSYVGPALKARGFYVLVNAGKWVAGDGASDTGALTAQWWQRLAPSVSGFHSEYWLQSPTDKSHLRGEGSSWNDNWTGWASLVLVAQNLGRDFFGMTYGSTANVQAMRYVRASFLLYWNGADGANLYQNESGDTWSTEWTMTPGTPTGSRFAVGVGWRRPYSGGTVLVNPSTTSSQTFALGGTYLMPDGSSVSSVTLGPKSGLVLRSTTTAIPTNTSPPTITGTSQQGVLQAATFHAASHHSCDVPRPWFASSGTAT